METTLFGSLKAFLWGRFKRYPGLKRDDSAVEELMRSFGHVGSSGPYTRDEMNER